MSLLLKQIFSLLKLLNSENGHNALAAGVACGFILGMTPVLSLQSLLVIAAILIFRVQLGAALVSAFFFSFVAWALDPAFDALGRTILESESLHDLFTAMYNVPLLPLTRFNNSIVMGAGILTVVLSPLVFIVARVLILKYRATVVAQLKQTKFWKAVQATSFYNWYYSYEKFLG